MIVLKHSDQTLHRQELEQKTCSLIDPGLRKSYFQPYSSKFLHVITKGPVKQMDDSTSLNIVMLSNIKFVGRLRHNE